MNDLILQKLLIIGFAFLISACSSRKISQGRVGYAPSFQPLDSKMEALHNRYDKH